LAFASLDEPARTKEGTSYLSFHAIDISDIDQQVAFFDYTDDVSNYLLREARFRKDRRRRHNLTLPRALPLPRLHSHQS
jgi:hypothetical protein